MQTAQVREQMVDQQVRAWDVLDERVLEVMRQVPRELFVPAGQRYRAYADAEVPLSHVQHMLRPSVAARLVKGLLPQPHEQVLEIGAGTGFITSCLRAMSAGVSSLEIHPDLADSARGNLAALGVRGVEVLDANALLFETGTRFDAIAVTASLPLYDERFARMLKIGGRLFIVVGEAPVMQAQLVRRTAEDSWSMQSLFETVIDPLVNAVRPPEFTF